jgi:poly-gamma-glutamate capsule biosynthesis protein CapA/YwtB (metallophosphatase superfamily)
MTAALVALGLLWSQPAAGAQPPAAAAPPVHFTVAASGDLLVHEPVAARALANGGGRRYAFGPMFAAIRKRIAGADLAICHMETPLVPGPVRGYPSFRTPPALARAVRATGWDACSTASNHSLDAGQSGIGTTLRALDRAGLRHAGTARSPAEARRTTMVDVNGVKVALLSFTAVSNGQSVPHAWSFNWASAGRILRDARRARRRGADAVIVNLHWGTEFSHAISPAQAALADRLTRSPAVTAIVGQHVHVVQPIRWVHRKPVVFGEGNLVSNQTAACCPPESQDGLIALIDFVARRGRVTAKHVRYVPVWVRHPDYRVLPATRGSLSWRRTVAAAGRPPG